MGKVVKLYSQESLDKIEEVKRLRVASQEEMLSTLFKAQKDRYRREEAIDAQYNTFWKRLSNREKRQEGITDAYVKYLGDRSELEDAHEKRLEELDELEEKILKEAQVIGWFVK